MPESKRVNLLVGGFVLVCLAGLIGLLVVLQGRTGATREYFTVYQNVAGLKFGTLVYFEGYQAGQVEAIEPITPSAPPQFKVVLSIDSTLAIPSDSEVQIVQPNLLSGRAISIAAGSAADAIEPGGMIIAGDVTGLAALPDLVGSGQSLIAEGEILLRQSVSAVAAVEALVGTDLPKLAESYRDLPDAMRAETAAIAADLRAVVASAQLVVDRAADLLDERTVTAVRDTITNIDAASAELAVASANLAQSSDDIASITQQVDGFLIDNKPDVEGAIVDLRYTLGSIASRVDAFSDNLEDSSRNMREFTRQLRLNPGLLLGGTAPVDEASAGE